MLAFRLLKAEEIECRIGTCKKNGLSLLLYKDARVDQSILDETVGPLNWQRHHSRDNANCIVSIWDDEKMQWIEKEDTGTESNTEKEKGLASDSFKRSCFNWGIGRELYTAPFIWIPSEKCNIIENNGRFSCFDRFSVQEIGYDENRNINRLVITKNNKVVYQLGQQEEPVPTKLEEKYISTLRTVIRKKGVSERSLLDSFSAQCFEDLTFDQFNTAMKKLSGMADR